MVHASAVPGAGGYQFAGVVAVRASDDNDDIRQPRQFGGSKLPLLGWLADGVNETNFGARKSLFNQRDELLHTVDGLRGLRRDPKAWSFSQIGHVVFVQHD